MRLVIIALSLALLAGVIAGQSSERNPLPAAVSLEQLHELGYQNMDTEQYLHLVTMVRPRCGLSFLERTAEDYMADDGWKRTEILGYFIPVDSNGREQEPLVVVYRDGKSYLLDPPLAAEPLDPGLYWSKGHGSAWTILRENAEEETYWIKYQR